MHAARMHYFTLEQRESLQAQLQSLVEQLRTELAGELRVPDYNEETNDGAVADVETSQDIAEIERTTRLLQAAEGALESLHELGL